MDSHSRDDHSLLRALMGDGRPLLAFTGLCLILAGGFALFLSAAGQFLPHDVQYLGMTAERLCELHQCRVVHFMLHDRAAFGGSIIAIGGLYLWLAEFPLRAGEPWAWWTFALSGAVGFGSFLTYLGYGYLDTWHMIATLCTFPCFLLGMWLSWRSVQGDRSWRTLLAPGVRYPWKSRAGIGRLLLLLTGVGVMGAGATIMMVGMTSVFVPQDLEFMGLARADLDAISDRLIPLIAHDRAGFGGGLCSTGLALSLCVWRARPARSLWEILALAGGAGFGCAVGVHFAIGYETLSHLLPAYLGGLIFLAGLVLSYGPMIRGTQR